MKEKQWERPAIYAGTEKEKLAGMMHNLLMYAVVIDGKIYDYGSKEACLESLQSRPMRGGEKIEILPLGEPSWMVLEGGKELYFGSLESCRNYIGNMEIVPKKLKLLEEEEK